MTRTEAIYQRILKLVFKTSYCTCAEIEVLVCGLTAVMRSSKMRSYNWIKNQFKSQRNAHKMDLSFLPEDYTWREKKSQVMIERCSILWVSYLRLGWNYNDRKIRFCRLRHLYFGIFQQFFKKPEDASLF